MAKSNFKKIINSDIPLILNFYADWCMPCNTFASILMELKKEMGDTIKIIKVDIEPV